MNLNAIFFRNVFQLQDKITMSQVRHLASPITLHSLQVQILQANQVITLAQLMRHLPLEIGTLVHDVLIQSLQLQLLALAVIAALLALREVARPASKLQQFTLYKAALNSSNSSVENRQTLFTRLFIISLPYSQADLQGQGIH